MRLGVYFGSFNPVHRGHMQIVYRLLADNLVDRVIIVATMEYWDKQSLMPLDTRIAMLKLYENENIIIDRSHNQAERTYQLFRQLHEDYPDDELYFVIGADSLKRFDQWVNYQELLRYPFIVVERDDIDITEAMEKLNKQNYLIMRRVRNVSSTYIREHLDENLEGMIDREVLEIMRSQRVFMV
ncbi:MAG: nicotinate-nicotinamide nucleotide adenylyltransferase [Erysipelotrichaceae bacterium]|nr:nicotinate-nicotinamide nucleotide adenylyltransferase [Erysipelotrichaceae bacterium]MBO4537819.1 nicotinate-nicotinamide nucleotide adenylyltransferase [Erysipelotrichaceae bacterium]MBR5048170.1 nicotinate-nicotinamide nucleotide adenylyltransferase [Erysipelotrichaceae bacterium]